MQTKTCTKCYNEYPATAEYFHLDKRNESKLRSCCKKCSYAYHIIWRKNNPEKDKEQGRKHYQENKKKCANRVKKYQKTLRGYITFLRGTIKQRCTNLNNPAYKNYGGRGIKCLFTSAELYDWIVANNVEPRGLDIHRIDNDGDYILDNIEFLTKSKHSKLHHLQKRKDNK